MKKNRLLIIVPLAITCYSLIPLESIASAEATSLSNTNTTKETLENPIKKINDAKKEAQEKLNEAIKNEASTKKIVKKANKLQIEAQRKLDASYQAEKIASEVAKKAEGQAKEQAMAELKKAKSEVEDAKVELDNATKAKRIAKENAQKARDITKKYIEHIAQKDLSKVLNIASDIFKKLEVSPLLQISNMKIPHILVDMFDELTLEDFRHLNIEKFLNLKVEWLSKLVYLQHIEQVDGILEIAPSSIKDELIKMKELCANSTCTNSVLAPMYYAKMLYYDELFFRVIQGNKVYARGGRYKNNELTSVGFAIYTDEIIESKVK